MCSQFASFCVLLTGLLFKMDVIGTEGEIPAALASPILIFVTIFPIVVAVYIVYFDIQVKLACGGCTK